MPRHLYPKAAPAKAKTTKTAKSPARKGSPHKPTPHPDAAGIDVGAREMVVCVPEDRDPESVRTFATFTQDLLALADWLVACRIQTVAMESTGNYWIPLHQILSARGLEVLLVNARHVRHVPGRKSDVLDCQWLQYLHSVGLLRGSFRPAQEVCALRSLVRQRDTLIAGTADQIRFMHSAFDQMNLQIHHVLSDLSGTTGMAIVRAIVAGERDSKQLARHRDRRVKASLEKVERSLQGDWRPEHLLQLTLALETWDHLQAQLGRLDEHIAAHLRQLTPPVSPVNPVRPVPPPLPKRLVPQGNQPRIDLRGEFCRLLGTDLTAVPGLSILTVQTFLSEVGPDLSRFANVACFASWLGLCPGTKISGGKVLDARSRPGKGRLARALRQSALTLSRQKGALGIRYRRLRSRLGTPKALTAMAHVLARIIFTLVREHRAYDESVFAKQEQAHLERERRRFLETAQRLGYEVTPRAEMAA